MAFKTRFLQVMQQKIDENSLVSVIIIHIFPIPLTSRKRIRELFIFCHSICCQPRRGTDGWCRWDLLQNQRPGGAEADPLQDLLVRMHQGTPRVWDAAGPGPGSLVSMIFEGYLR